MLPALSSQHAATPPPPAVPPQLPAWHVTLIIGTFVCRGAFAVSAYPLEESLLMDFVSKERRGRWKSLESVSAFGWAGSAALGGVLADQYSYSFTFLITAVIQFVAIGLESSLLGLVPRFETAGVRSSSRD